ncbi:hypothetical protein JMJ77_0001254 [Colletotrichum scovillei]|uniref:Uncharacterized protein n=1 Tax=Colletotrichum scovillei TaxID=1209932 RepID=A0A9P7RBP8_9PEZI|nr:hypothetical protein JMJ77_0001254 [Colletotrichum scovillei]KAG7072480.1 hypothetical protein JMJ76_0005329 [Colletotrichum scovillei]KAG7080847.1 hypothetical protein JMJ78_0007931 [Colletotrichum scovillei]
MSIRTMNIPGVFLVGKSHHHIFQARVPIIFAFAIARGAFFLNTLLSYPAHRVHISTYTARMYAASNRATVNGNTPPPRTEAQVQQAQQLQQNRIQSFLGDNNGPRTMHSHASTSADESMAKHRASAARKIENIMANLNR